MINQELTQYPAWRLWPVHLVAKLFGVLVKVDGYPFGSGPAHGATEEVSGATEGGAAGAGDDAMVRKLALTAVIHAAQDRQRAFDAALAAAGDVARRTAFSPKQAAEDVIAAALAANKALERGENKD